MSFLSIVFCVIFVFYYLFFVPYLGRLSLGFKFSFLAWCGWDLQTRATSYLFEWCDSGFLTPITLFLTIFPFTLVVFGLKNLHHTNVWWYSGSSTQIPFCFQNCDVIMVGGVQVYCPEQHHSHGVVWVYKLE